MCVRLTFSMHSSVVGGRLSRRGVDVLPLTTFAAHEIFLASDIMLPVLLHQGLMHECHLDMTKRNLLSEF